MALRQWKRQPLRDGATLVLILVVALVGIGSFLFHTLATRWAGLADVVPIAVFIHLYFFFAMRRVLALRPWPSERSRFSVCVLFLTTSAVRRVEVSTRAPTIY